MVELPTFYGWLLRIGSVGIIILLAYLYIYVEDKYPWIAKYIVMPIAMIATAATIIVFIITQ